MIYAVLDYKITYTDKTTKSGHVPFRGYDTDNNTFRPCWSLIFSKNLCMPLCGVFTHNTGGSNSPKMN
jgi:hypothetical protein